MNTDSPGDGASDEGREEFAIEHLTSALSEDYADELPPDEVKAAIDAAHDSYADVPVREFVPILVERDARETLNEELDEGAAERAPEGSSHDDK